MQHVMGCANPRSSRSVAIHRIAHHRMPDVVEVNPELMSPARLGPALHQSVETRACEDLELRPGCSPSRVDAFPVPLSRGTSKWLVDHEAISLRIPVNQRQVPLAYLSGAELLTEILHGLLRARDEEYTTRLPIEAMDHTRTASIIVHTWEGAQVVNGEGRDGRIRAVSHSMGEQSGGLRNSGHGLVDVEPLQSLRGCGVHVRSQHDHLTT